MTQVAGGVMGGINGLGSYNQYANLMPQAQQTTQNLYNNPYGQQWMQGAQQGAGAGQAAAGNMFGAGGADYGMGSSIWNTAGDPQNALYNRTLGQVQQQSRAGQAARGVLTSPYGAGLEDQDTRNFNIDWQNQQLQRQIAGGNAAGGLYGQGSQLQSGASNLFNQSSAMPYNAYQGIGQQQLGALSQLGQFGQAGSNQAQDPIRQQLALLGVGVGANNSANQNYGLQLQANNMANNQSNAMWQGLGGLAGTIAGGPIGGAIGSGLSSMFTGGGGYGTGQRGQNWWS